MKKFKFTGLVIFLAFVATACATKFHEVKQRPVTFILYDAGETKAMEPVFVHLRNKKVPMQVIAVGTARDIAKSNPDYFDIYSKCDFGSFIDAKWPKELSVPQRDLERLEACIDPGLVVSGMSSTFQEQAVTALQKKNRIFWGYYDSFSKQAIDGVSQTMVSGLAKILVPSKSIREAVVAKYPTKSVVVVGQPTLEEWRRYASEIDAREVLKKLKLTKTYPVIVYTGGYGEDYESSFRMFVKEAAKMKDIDVLISLHPKVDGTLERAVIQEVGANNMLVVDKTIPTHEIAIIADLIVTHRSSAGVQSVFLGKPVLYLDSRAGAYSDLALEMGWAKQLVGPENFVTVARSRIREHSYTLDRDIYGMAGIPRDSSVIIAEMIEKELLK